MVRQRVTGEALFKPSGVLVRGMSRAPAPVMRLWFYLNDRHPGGYSGTPGMLIEEIREAGVKLSRRAMGDALAQMEMFGMISTIRHGHHVEIELVGADA